MQIRQLFGFCGGVIGVDRVGEEKQYVFVEYTYPAVQLRPYNLFVLHKVSRCKEALRQTSGHQLYSKLQVTGMAITAFETA